ncbi:MAG: hypothetical protein MHM6MM_003915 [Cercozoa sp. M6MM]
MLLRRVGADFSLCDRDGRTVAHVAAMSRSVPTLLFAVSHTAEASVTQRVRQALLQRRQEDASVRLEIAASPTQFYEVFEKTHTTSDNEIERMPSLSEARATVPTVARLLTLQRDARGHTVVELCARMAWRHRLALFALVRLHSRALCERSRRMRELLPGPRGSEAAPGHSQRLLPGVPDGPGIQRSDIVEDHTIVEDVAHAVSVLVPKERRRKRPPTPSLPLLAFSVLFFVAWHVALSQVYQHVSIGIFLAICAAGMIALTVALSQLKDTLQSVVLVGASMGTLATGVAASSLTLVLSSRALVSSILAVVFCALASLLLSYLSWADRADAGDARNPSQTLAEVCRLQDVIAGGNLPTSAHFCYSCFLWRPPRSKHCRFTGRCVPRYDHFCLWLRRAIGRDNHRAFLLFLVCTLAACSCLFVLYLQAWYPKEANSSKWLHQTTQGTVACLSVSSVLASLFLVTLLAAQTKVLIMDELTNETINARKSPYSTVRQWRARHGYEGEPPGCLALCGDFWCYRRFDQELLRPVVASRALAVSHEDVLVEISPSDTGTDINVCVDTSASINN